MKNKIVIWGTNAASEKVLIALELQPDTNKVLLHTFPEAIASEEFVAQMMESWRNNKEEVVFPEGHTTIERELSVTDKLLPEGLTPERDDIIQRAQTEWHFVVLSTKLHKAYRDELEELKEKVQQLSSFEGSMWDNLKSFWDKVQEQARERNIFREHADSLRDDTNALFEDLKKMRAKVQDEFLEASKGVFNEFNEKLDEIDARIQAGGNKLNSVLEELKGLQRKYRDSKLANEHRNKIWNRLDGAFKAAKERKFGPGANEGSATERHERRLEGLADAIKRMEDSVRRDEEDLNFQQKKVAGTEGQLESQIRQAKIKMVEERLISKREKLEDMHKTRTQVERQIAQAKEKEDKRQKMDAAKEVAKEAIAAEVKTSTKTEAKPAAETIGEKAGGILEALSNVLGETLEDVGDTVKAVASVLGEKAEKAFDEAMTKAEEFVDDMSAEKEAEAPVAEETAVEAAAEVAEAPAVEEAPAEETEAPVKKTKAKKKED